MDQPEILTFEAMWKFYGALSYLVQLADLYSEDD